jgi:Flp pilus assembly protein TadD
MKVSMILFLLLSVTIGGISCTELMQPVTPPVTYQAPPVAPNQTSLQYIEAAVTAGNYQTAIDGAKVILAEQVSDPVTLAGARKAMAAATRGLAVKARTDGQIGDAVNLARGLVDALPNQPESFSLLAEMLSSAKQRDEADTALKHALDLGPASSVVHRARGIIMADRGDLSSAIIALRKTTELDSDDAESWSSLARVLALAGKLPEAVIAQTKAVKVQTTSADHRNRLALLQLLSGDLDASEATVKGTLETCKVWAPPVGKGNSISLSTAGIELTMSGKAARTVSKQRFNGNDRIEYPVIFTLRANGPAAKGGAQVGDIVTTVHGKDLKNLDNKAIVDAFHPRTPDGSLELIVSRGDRNKATQSTLKLQNATWSFGSTALLSMEGEPAALNSRIILARGFPVRALRLAEDANEALPRGLALTYSIALAALASGDSGKVIKIIEGTATGLVDGWLGTGPRFLTLAIAFALNRQVPNALSVWEQAMATGGILDCELHNKGRAALRKAVNVESLIVTIRTSRDRATVIDALNILRKLAWTPSEQAEVRELAIDWGKRQNPVPPLSEEARNNLLRMSVFLREKDSEAAAKEIKIAIALAPWDPSLYYNAAIVAAEANQYDKATAFMNTYVKACPTNANAAQSRDLIVQWSAMAERKAQGH